MRAPTMRHSDGMIEVRFTRCVVRIWPDAQYLETVFEWDKKVPATSNPDHEPSVQLAHELGYSGDCWRMSLEHELLHTFLSEAQGLEHSPTLYGVAVGQYAPRHVYQFEEGQVIAMQAYLHRGTVAPALDGLNLPALAGAFRKLLAQLEPPAPPREVAP